MPDTLKRGKSWGLYMTGSNPDHPFVILDEWVAYIVSAQVANELYGAAETRVKSVSRSGPVTDTLSEIIIDRSNAVDFAGYATILLRCVERFDPDYPDMDTLREFVSVNIQRTLDVQMTPVTVAYQRYFQQFNPKCYQPQGRIQPGRVEAVIHPPTLEPIPPKPQQPAVKGCTCDSAALIARITKLEAELLLIKNTKPIPGPAGPEGKQGPAGPQGAPGKDAQPPAIDAIVKQLPPIGLEFLDADGNTIARATQSARPGGKFQIKPLPLRVLRSEADYDDLLIPLDGVYRGNVDMQEMK